MSDLKNPAFSLLDSGVLSSKERALSLLLSRHSCMLLVATVTVNLLSNLLVSCWLLFFNSDR